ncbi:hypothetical protein BU15DRAFT_49453 [Melanogaster broomeanus]|nr:hypothetical protein BU15DRAFT_49453 [Melanogaster broomeanus]
MSSSYTLKIGGTVGLNADLTTDGIIIFRSASLDLTPVNNAGIDNASINLNDGNGNRLLHVSFRRAENAIVFNTSTNEGWGPEERVALGGKFFKPDITLMVYDHGDRFQILIDYRSKY